MVLGVRCGYDFVLVDRLVYTSVLIANKGIMLFPKSLLSTFIRMPHSRWLGIIHTCLMKGLEGSTIHSFTH